MNNSHNTDFEIFKLEINIGYLRRIQKMKAIIHFGNEKLIPCAPISNLESDMNISKRGLTVDGRIGISYLVKVGRKSGKKSTNSNKKSMRYFMVSIKQSIASSMQNILINENQKKLKFFPCNGKDFSNLKTVYKPFKNTKLITYHRPSRFLQNIMYKKKFMLDQFHFHDSELTADQLRFGKLFSSFRYNYEILHHRCVNSLIARIAKHNIYRRNVNFAMEEEKLNSNDIFSNEKNVCSAECDLRRIKRDKLKSKVYFRYKHVTISALNLRLWHIIALSDDELNRIVFSPHKYKQSLPKLSHHRRICCVRTYSIGFKQLRALKYCFILLTKL
eukprot:gnl/MRDRNA2_/MRDRNA2_85885_c1_seq2.p1 gnl/MRDRNA2_/MRDRNA2_85885_c1~~gnl/MRDRNA2_/MRDRNA2_85885_c1_seq2.p1  ORF type:complete len:331 (+),score=-7.95 gnl/MRDRNA2_/MRDRNA2_85885_c1_seq2:55-1047(+)